MIKGSIQDCIVLINAINIYIEQTDIKGEIDDNTIIVGDFNTPLTSPNRSCREKINKVTVILNDAIDQLDVIDT